MHFNIEIDYEKKRFFTDSRNGDCRNNDFG